MIHLSNTTSPACAGYVVAGLHVEASANLGWRNETERPDGNGYDAFHARL